MLPFVSLADPNIASAGPRTPRKRPTSASDNPSRPIRVSLRPTVSHTRYETSRGFCGSGALGLAVRGRFAAGGPLRGTLVGEQALGLRPYRCSLGTNAELGLVTNGLFEVPLDGGAENCSIR